MSLLETLTQRRADSRTEIDALLNLDLSARESGDLTEQEQARFEELRTTVIALDERIATVAEAQRRSDAAAAARVETGQTGERTGGTAPQGVVKEERTYRHAKNAATGRTEADPTGPSYFRDLTRASLNLPGAAESRSRLERNSREVALETRALTTTDGAGGDFVPPEWMVAEYIALARAARPIADRVQNKTLPMGTDSINLPRLVTGTAVAEQSTQNVAVQNTDATTGAIAANVTTIAGQQVLAVQLIEQSPVNLDDILLADLALDYSAKVDVFVVNNNAAGKVGILNVAGTNAVTYTSASPTVGALYSKLADATQQIYTGRFLQPDTIAMHPRRWAWFLAAVDSSNRPLVLPNTNQGNYNALGISNGLGAQGPVGELFGIPVIIDPNLPTNLGAGTNQDPIIVMRAADLYLWEGQSNAEAFRETKADQLSVLLRFYRYVAFTGARYVKSISVVNGTGVIAPVF